MSDEATNTSVVDNGTPKPSLRKSRYVRWALGVTRIVLFVFGLWSLFFYFWSLVGVAIGAGITLFSKKPAWRRHGIVLSFSIAIAAPLMAVYAYLWTLLVYLFLFGYLFVALVHFAIKIVIAGIRRLRGRPQKQTSISSTSPKPRSLIRTVLVLAIILAPFAIWSSVNLDLGVMFDNAPALLWVHTPSTVDVGTEFEILVEAWDSFERLSGSFRGTVDFTIESYNLTTGLSFTGVDASLPDEYAFTGSTWSAGIVPAYMMLGPEDFGMHSFSAQINTPGIHYILVEDSHTENTYWSNPIIVDDYPDGSPMIYWGDLHGHSMVSDGSGTAEESYYVGRYVSGLDFMSLTDHGEHFTMFDRSKAGSPEFENYKSVTANAYVPSEFVSLYGAEWTSNYVIQPLLFVPTPIASGGHYTCVFSGDDLPLFSAITENTIDDLWSVLDDFTSSSGARALAIPHHTIRSMFIQDWTLMNPDYVKLVEVTSVHGECLFDNELNYRGSVDLPATRVRGSSVIEAINMGYRMTFMANGDNHDGHPGHSISHTRASIGHQYPFTIYNARNGHPYPGGITAVYATSLTREGVFTGLENGRVYATSDHGRPVLEFSINGESVSYNSTVMVPMPTSARNISIFIAQDSAPAAGLNQAATAGTNWIPDWTATVEIIKNGELWQTVEISTPTSRIFVSDDSALTGIEYDGCIQGEDGNYYINDHSSNPIDPSTLNTGGMDYYTVRIVSENGRSSYIGPIWVTSP